MLIDIPITQLAEEWCGSEHEVHKLTSDWDRTRELGVGGHPVPLLDYWGRHKKHFPTHADALQIQTELNIPHAVQLGAGEMHLDDWFEPDQLLRHAASDGIFELRINVSEFKLAELKLTLDNETRVLTIEGRHSEQHIEHPVESQYGHDHSVTRPAGSLRAHFKRSFTLSAAVLEKGIECQLTELTPDDHHLILTAPVDKSLAYAETVADALDPHPHSRLCTERDRCANLVKCICTSDE